MKNRPHSTSLGTAIRIAFAIACLVSCSGGGCSGSGGCAGCERGDRNERREERRNREPADPGASTPAMRDVTEPVKTSTADVGMRVVRPKTSARTCSLTDVELQWSADGLHLSATLTVRDPPR